MEEIVCEMIMGQMIWNTSDRVQDKDGEKLWAKK